MTPPKHDDCIKRWMFLVAIGLITSALSFIVVELNHNTIAIADHGAKLGVNHPHLEVPPNWFKDQVANNFREIHAKLDKIIVDMDRVKVKLERRQQEEHKP